MHQVSTFNLELCHIYFYILPPGVLAPVYGVGVLLADSIQDPINRLAACEVTHACLAVISTFHCSVLMCGLIFRWVLIRFSDRGLVVQGRPMLGLFNQLYWVVFGTFCCITISIFTIVPFIKGDFEDSIPGRKCMLQPIETNNKGANRVMIRNTFHLLWSTYAIILKFKV